MQILALDTSSQSASCAVLRDGVLLGEFFSNVKLTHSQTILPMTENLLQQCGLSLTSMDAFAVTTGPGSFTGLRIGLSAVKGMAHALKKPCIGVSTLEAMAWAYQGVPCHVAPVLDARCSQVYTAFFSCGGEKPQRLWEDQALSLSELQIRLKKAETSVFLVGDGAQMCYNIFKEHNLPVFLASPALRYTKASWTALAAEQLQAMAVDPKDLVPAYLRLPQAQRELLARRAAAGGA